MTTFMLDKIFKPQRIALIGVTINPKSVGGTVLRNLVGGGYRGVVYPVNPTHEAVLGVPCYPSVSSLPKVPDLAIICSPAAEVPDLVHECGSVGIKGIIIISAGFRETGPDGQRLEAAVLAVAAQFDGMRILGPNCLGIIVPAFNLNATFATGMPKEGHIAFVSQSGALCTSVLDWALEESIGFSHFVSIGNTIDVDFGDLIDYFGEDEKTTSIILYIESLTNVRKFMTAARSFARTKPIVAYKAGRFPESAQAAASHTGALAAEDAIYDAAFRRAGIVRVYEIGDIFNCAELIGRHRIPLGSKLGIITNAGGPGVMATDALIAEQGTLATLSPDTMAALNENLPPFWSHSNPVDVLGDVRPNRYAKAMDLVLRDPGVDAVLGILTPQAMTNPTGTAMSVSALRESASKPILAAWLGGQSMREGIQLLNKAGIATYQTPEQAVRAFMTLVTYARNLEMLYETPRDLPVLFSIDRKTIKDKIAATFPDQATTLTEVEAKTILAAYGISVIQPEVATTVEQALTHADTIGYPVVLKLLSPDISHKSDVGGVALGLQNANEVREAFTQIIASSTSARPEARITGVTVQQMANTTNGLEMILGIKRDRTFGSVILAGLGGVAAEIFGDRSLGFPPLNERLARMMLESLKCWPLLQGFRGKPKAAIDKLIETMIRLSYLAADFPEILELDINPLLVTAHDVVALDSRILVDVTAAPKSGTAYSHLALHPYPEEYVRTAKLRDGSPIILRPIKPEDEPLWMNLLAGCSRESIYMRFRYLFQWQTHEVAARYCYIDYAREIAIVAELEHPTGKKLIGVGRLVADPEHETAEYAVLIADAWQNRGVGSLLTDYCMEIAQQWGVKRVVAQTTADNPRMIAVFNKREFKIQADLDGVVDVVKRLEPGESSEF